jgi:glycosyltransferase involved in cell wall biosynthesis
MATIVLATSYNTSAVSQYFVALAQELVQRGHQVILLIDKQKYDLVNQNANPALLTWPSKRPTHLRDAFFLHKVIKQYRPDCVIGNFAAGNLCALISWFNRVPHRWLWYHTMSKASLMEHELPYWKIRLLQWRKRLTYRIATLIISVSKAAASDLQITYGVSAVKASLVLPCLLADPDLDNERVDANKVVCVGRLINFKGQETLIRAAKSVAQAINNLQIEFVGDGPDRKRLEQLAETLGVSEFCHFPGNVEHKEVLHKIASATVCVTPSYTDALGMVNIEALSVGTPVIATCVDGIVEVVEDGKVGYLFPPDNAEILAGKIINLLKDHELRRTLSSQARNSYLGHFSYNVLPEQVDQIESMLHR